MLLIPTHEIQEDDFNQVLDDYFEAGNIATLYGWIDIHHYYEVEDGIQTNIWVSFGSFEDARIAEDNIEITHAKKGCVTFEAYVDEGGHLLMEPTEVSTMFSYTHIEYGMAHNHEDEEVTYQLFFLL